jgi:hypothetical protein
MPLSSLFSSSTRKRAFFARTRDGSISSGVIVVPPRCIELARLRRIGPVAPRPLDQAQALRHPADLISRFSMRYSG